MDDEGKIVETALLQVKSDSGEWITWSKVVRREGWKWDAYMIIQMSEKPPTRIVWEKNDCESCGGCGYLDTTEDKIERCDMCKKFPNDDEARKAVV